MRGHKILYGASTLMVLGFLINLIVDLHRYNTTFGSAPFWLWIVADAATWLVPALLAALAGYIAQRRLAKKEN